MPSEPPAGSPDASRHLHPLSLLFTLGSAAWRLLVPALLFLVFSRGDRFEAFFAILFFPAAATALFRFLTFRYRFAQDELIVRQGLISTNERHIPYRRIQSIDLIQNPIQRALGVADVRVQTASGDEVEASFRVLAVDAVEEMRRKVFAGREDALSAPESGPERAAEGHVLARLTWTDLAIHGIVANRGMVLVAAALGLWWQLTIDRGRPEPPFDPEGLVREIGAFPSLGGWPFTVAAVVGVLLFIRLLSVIHAWATLHAFTLEERGDDLRVSYGLFTRVSATIPRHRIQTVTVREGPLHRLFGRVSLRVQTAGGAAREDDGRSAARTPWLVPIWPRDKTAELVRAVQPELDPEGLEWRGVHAKSARRLFFRRLPFALLVAAAAGVAAWPWGFLVLAPLLAWNALRSVLDARWLAWARTGRAVASRSGWWVRRVTLARQGKVQAVSLRRTPFDRRHGTARLLVDTAGSGGGRVSVPFVPWETALSLHDELSEVAARTSFRW
jgi:putative membrane protein